MKARLTFEGVIDAPADTVVAALMREPITVGFADPIDPRRAGENDVEWRSVPDAVEELPRRAVIEPEGEGSRVRLTADLEVKIPYFSWVFHPLIKGAAKRSLARMFETADARCRGVPDPKHARPVWAATDRLSSSQVLSISTICMILAITTYGGSLFSQLINYVARTYGAGNTQLGVISSISRLGTLASVAGSVLADRKGRRTIMLFATTGLCIVTLLGGIAPNLIAFASLQVLSRGFLNMAAVVAFVALIEEAPEGARAYTMALASIAGGAGYALGSLLLPVADLSAEAWRFHFVLGGAGLLLVPGIARRLKETARFASLGERVERARSSEIVDKIYGGRFFVVAISGFLINFHAAPFSQFMNRYLADERGFGGFGILALRFVTQGIPALIAVWIGGRLAESEGRRPIAIAGTIVASVAAGAFFLGAGPALWIGLFVTTVAGALTGPAFATFNTELFPTEVRGTAGAALLGIGVAGSALGLLAVGFASRTLDSIGTAVAFTAVAPILVGLFLIHRLPEGRGRLLDEISPPEV